jgi:phosphotransferase system enzyme I (PtsP)
LTEGSAHLSKFGHALPRSCKLGAMLEVPALLWQLDELMADRSISSRSAPTTCSSSPWRSTAGNAHLSDRFDPMSVPFLRCCAYRRGGEKRNGTPVTLCGELAGKPLSAMALLGLGFRSVSMSPASDRSGEGDAAWTGHCGLANGNGSDAPVRNAKA